jgi:hypothetical protein
MMIDRTVLKPASEPTVAAPSAERGASTGRAAPSGRASSDGAASWLLDLNFRSPIVIAGAAAIVLVAALLGWFVFRTPGSASVAPTPNVKPDSPPPATAVDRPEPPAPAPPAVASLQLTSQPDGARVVVDGRDTGRNTPTQLQIDPARPPSRIQLALQGFRTEEAAVTAETVKRGSLDVPLSPLEVTRVSLVASGDYEFEVVGRQRLLSPAATRHDVVLSGLQSVQLRSTRYFLDQAVRVDRASGGRVDVAVPPLGSITVYAAGVLEDCKVYIDDRIVDSGSLPVTNREIASGAHRVQLKCTRGDTDAQVVSVPPRNGFTTRFGANTPLRLR